MSDRDNLHKSIQWAPRWLLVVIVVVVGLPFHLVLNGVGGWSDWKRELEIMWNVDK